MLVYIQYVITKWWYAMLHTSEFWCTTCCWVETAWAYGPRMKPAVAKWHTRHVSIYNQVQHCLLPIPNLKGKSWSIVKAVCMLCLIDAWIMNKVTVIIGLCKALVLRTFLPLLLFAFPFSFLYQNKNVVSNFGTVISRGMYRLRLVSSKT